MDENPYRSPRESAERHLSHTGDIGIARILAAFGWFCGSTVGGLWLGVLVGVMILTALPRDSQPGCGNSVIHPIALGGALLGMFIGIILARRAVLVRRLPDIT